MFQWGTVKCIPVTKKISARDTPATKEHILHAKIQSKHNQLTVVFEKLIWKNIINVAVNKQDHTFCFF